MTSQSKSNYRILIADDTRKLPQQFGALWSEVDQVEIVPKPAGDERGSDSLEAIKSEMIVLEICASESERTELVDRMKGLLAPPFVMVLSQPPGSPVKNSGVRVDGCYLVDPNSDRKHFPA